MEYTCEMIVTNDKTAQSMQSGDLQVLATPAMVALMEKAAMLCVKDLLPQGYTTVGTKINVDHIKATPLNEKVTATASLISKTERQFEFKLQAFQGEQLIGEGVHTRFSVNAEKFLSKLN